MTIQKDKKYILRFEVNNSYLVYTAVILSVDSNFVSFIDKFGKEVSFNIKNLVSYEEVSND